MIETAQRMKHFKTSVFTSLKELKKQYEKEHNQKTIDFSLGSPNITPDPQIMNVLAEAVEQPENYKYAVTALPQLIESIQKWYRNRYEVDLEK